VGGGTAGLVAAIGAAGLGGRVALIEGGLMGGDCLNWGCVPSKALLRSARAAHDAREAKRLGVTVGDVVVDFGAVMQRMRDLRAQIAHHDSFERVRSEGVDTYLGHARFTGHDRVEVDGRTLTFARAVIATGARPRIPPIEGLHEVGSLTNETVFQLTERPERLLVIGAGPIGCELAQCFRRFGSHVVLVDLEDRVLPRDDPDAATVVADQLRAEGIELHLGHTVERVRREGDERIAVLSSGGKTLEVRCDAVLLSAGRVPNTSDLGLDAAGVELERGAVKVDEYLCTTNPRIYASGDVTGRWQFTHTADAMSRLVLRNALFFGRSRVSALTVPWATYTSPEVAHVGRPHDKLATSGATCTRIELSANDRAILDGETAGFVKVWTDSSGRVIAATVVAEHAGELIGELTLAITAGLKLSVLADTIHPYPTVADAFRAAGNAHRRTTFQPWMRSLTERLLTWRR
jgi:pyruvate/2-oxoglutarate dehydrogenase complex dihydrolipoamide dehydrogenase (E3) component